MPHRCVDMETTIGGRIREQRKAKGLSVAELAEKAGLSESMIEKLEQGARGQRIPASTAFVIADLFGCNVRWLVTGDVMQLSMGIKPDDRFYCFLPLYHGAASLSAGATDANAADLPEAM